MTFSRNPASLAAILILLALQGCERTRVTPPVEMRNLRVTPTKIGLDISFELIDSRGQPTIMMFGNGVVRIDDSPDSVQKEVFPGHPAGSSALDSTWLLYNARLFVTREHFVIVRGGDSARGQDKYLCSLGVYPYSHFLRKPKHPTGNVRVALVGMDGRRVLLGHAPVVWPPEAFSAISGTGDQSRFGNR
ncbi:MAG TPA: hypothetical protein PLE60_03525 [Candidatus Latescibacteria bacterium]|nr:MAG: hypothetical protein BWY06_02620 [Candidatus Latescibacteria bacterium ADurb.Bin168]HPU84393.1 hypothetical protein [Candidatus Latescibacterota bacterium]